MYKLKLKEYLAEKGITQTDLAERLGCTRQNIQYLLSHSNPTVETLARICETLNCKIEDIIKKGKGKGE